MKTAIDYQKINKDIARRCNTIAKNWCHEIAGTSYSPLKTEQIQKRLSELTAQIISVLLAERFEAQKARSIGASFANLHFIQPEVLGKSQLLLAHELVKGLSAEQTLTLQPRLAAILGELAWGFTEKARKIVLHEQDQIHRALVSRLQETDQALREANEELERRVEERTAALSLANEELRAEILERIQIEKALQESEETARVLLNAPTDVVILLDPEGTILDANDIVAQRLGVKKEQLIGTCCWDLFPPDIAESRKCYADKVFQTCKPIRFEDERQGTWFDQVVYPLFNERGDVDRIALFARDITDRKKAEEALRESEKKYRSLVETSPDAIMLTDMDGKILVCNRQANLLHNPDGPKSLVGKNAFDLIEPDSQQPRLEHAIKEMGRGGIMNGEFSLFRHDGSRFPGEVNASLLTDAHGNPQGIISVSRDITERKQAAEALLESEQNFSMLAENANDGIFIADNNGDILYVNQRGAYMLGDDLSKIIGKNMKSFLLPEDFEPNYTRFQKRNEGEGVHKQYEVNMVMKDGKMVPVEVTSGRTLWKGKPAGMAFVRDISERKRTERELIQNSADIARLHEELKTRRIEEQASLLDLSQTLLDETERQKVLENTISVLTDVFQPDFSEISFLDNKKTILQLTAGQGWATEPIGTIPIPTEDGYLSGYTLKVQQPVRVENFETENRFHSSPLHEDHGIASGITVPMSTGKQINGLMGVYWKKARTISDNEMNMLPLIANTTSATLDRVRMFESEKQRSANLERSNALITALSKMAIKLASSLKPFEILETLGVEFRKLDITCVVAQLEPNSLSITKIYILVGNERLQLTEIETGLNLSDSQLSQLFLKYIHDEVLEHRRGIFDSDVAIDMATSVYQMERSDAERLLDLIKVSPNAYSLTLPLVIGTRVIGVLGLYGEDLREEDLPVITVFANQIAIALENARLFEEISLGRQRLRELSSRLVKTQEMERQQIARELHDEIGQVLTGLSLMLNALPTLDEVAADTLINARTLVEELIGTVQYLSLDLRPPMLDEMGLLPTLVWFFQRFQSQTGIQVNFEHSRLNQAFPENLATTAYRINQEALTNVARHAGVKEVEVRVWVDQETLSIQVEDQGNGFNLEEVQENITTIGLTSMEERAALIGGKIEFASTPGGGTTMMAILPVQSEDMVKTNAN